jgi:hypothetical protein
MEVVNLTKTWCKYFEPSTPPACAEHLHFMLNRENKRAPGPPIARAHTAWEDADKVS